MAPLGPFDNLPERGHQQHHPPQVTSAAAAHPDEGDEALTSNSTRKNGAPQGALVIIDPISSGAILALLGQRRGYRLIAVYSEGLEAELKAMVPAECKEEGLSFDHTIEVRCHVLIL